MKIRTIVLSFLLGAVVLSMGYEYSRAEPKADKPSSKIGVVNIQQIFLICKRNAKYEEETKANRIG